MFNAFRILQKLRTSSNELIIGLADYIEKNSHNWCYGKWEEHLDELDNLLINLDDDSLVFITNELLNFNDQDIYNFLIWLLTHAKELQKRLLKDPEIFKPTESVIKLREKIMRDKKALNSIANFGSKVLKDFVLDDEKKGKIKLDEKIKKKLKGEKE